MSSMQQRAGRCGLRRTASTATLALAATALLACNRAEGQQDWRQLDTQRAVAGEQELRVDVEYGAGRFRIEPAAEDELYRMNLRYDASSFGPVHSYESGRLRLGIEGSHPTRGRNVMDGHLTVGVNTRVPTDLTLKFGAATANLELGGIRLRRLSISTGASETQLSVASPNPIACESVTLEAGAARFHARGLGNLNAGSLRLSGGVGDMLLGFGGEWQQNMNATIDVGLGSVTLELPRGLGVRVQRRGRLATFDGQELTQRGDAYFSHDWESAEHRLDITLNAALGTVRVVWTDGTEPI
jgi:hypothetical protein